MNWKKIFRKILFPPAWLVVLLSIASAVLLTLVFIKGWEMHPIAYVIYVLAFYSLSVVCVICWFSLPQYYGRVKAWIHRNKYTNRYLSDVEYKNRVKLFLSLGVNLLYVGVHTLSAYYYKTWWFVIFSIYYMILAIMHFLLIRYIMNDSLKKSRIGELRRSRLCGYILLLINFVLSGAVLMMVFFHRGFEYQGILIYVMAVYTFYMTVMAVINLIRYRKYKSPIMATANVIKVATALVSMLSLETAMFSQFGADMSWESQKIMIMATGGGIAVIVITLAVKLIADTTKEIRKIRRTHSYDK